MSPDQAPSRADSAALLEPQIAGILSKILGVAADAIPRQAPFLSYGCDSIVLVMLATRLSEKFGVDLTVFQLFEVATLEALSRYIPQRVNGAQLPAPTALTIDEPRARSFISCGQWLFWRLAIRSELASYFNLRLAVMLRGPLDVPALQASLQQLVNRHDALRLHFAATNPSDPETVELVVPARVTPSFTVVEPGLNASSDPTEIVMAVLRREIEQPFDLFGEPLVRFKLVAFGPTLHAFLITMHHLVTDEWSLNILKQELLRLYAAHTGGEPAALPERPLQFADYAEWSHKLHQTEPYRAQLHYWDELFVSLGRFDLKALASLSDPGAGAGTTFADLSIDTQDVSRLTARGAWHGTTPYVLLQAVMHLALYSLFPGLERMLTLSPVAERHRAELQHSVGLYLTIVGVPSTITSGMTLKAFVAQLKRSVQEALETAEARQFALYDISQHRADDFPLFVYNYLVLPNDSDWAWHGLQAEPVIPLPDTRRFVTMLELYHGRSPAGMWGALKYDNALLSADAAERFSKNYRRIFETVLSGNDDVPVTKLITA